MIFPVNPGEGIGDRYLKGEGASPYLLHGRVSMGTNGEDWKMNFDGN